MLSFHKVRDAAVCDDPTSNRFPVTADFADPDWSRLMTENGVEWVGPRRAHRKQWELWWITSTLTRHGMLRTGKRGLVFASGKERSPAVFASRGARITATDLAPDGVSGGGAGIAAVWAATNQHPEGLEDLWDKGKKEEEEERGGGGGGRPSALNCCLPFALHFRLP